MSELYDVGLQPERTRLAWRRTVLVLFLGAVVAERMLAPKLGYWSLVIGLVGLSGAGFLAYASHRRAGRVVRALTAGEPLPSGGALVAVLSTLVTGGAIIALVLVVLT